MFKICYFRGETFACERGIKCEARALRRSDETADRRFTFEK
jgi:hypothetical protein